MKTLTASDRSALIRLAASFPKGSSERKVILAELSREADFSAQPEFPPTKVTGSPTGVGDSSRDKFMLEITEKFGNFYIQVLNPNRGGAYFGFKNPEELDKIVAAFTSAVEKAKQETKEYKEKYRRWLESEFEARKNQ